jgi:hypothetical protein
MQRLRLHELATGQSLLQSDTSNSPLVRPLSIPMGPLQSKDCIIAVRSASQLAQQLAEHAGKVSCVITAFGTCQSLQAELGNALYDRDSKDKVSTLFGSPIQRHCAFKYCFRPSF